MADIYWLGVADPIAQVTTIQVTAYDAATTYMIKVNGVVIATTPGVTDADGTASALKDDWEASTHAYATGITATVATDTVTLTGTAGVPFTVTSAVSGGSGTIGAPSTTTSATGPNFADEDENWSGGAAPGASDAITFKDSSINCVWGLDQIDFDEIYIHQSYTGKIGLRRDAVATSADAETVDTSATEYRPDYLEGNWTTAVIGRHVGPGDPNGAGRLKLDNQQAGASTTTIDRTTASGADTGLPAVRLLFAHANADVYVNSAQGGVGIAVDEPGETSTVGDISIADISGVSRVYLGEGVTLTNFEQAGGTNVVQAAATITLIEVNGGTLTLDGDFTVTTLTINGGTVNANHVKTAGNAITTANVNGGILNGRGSNAARTWATVNPDGGEIVVDDGIVTITTLDQPAGARRLAVTDAL